MAGRLTLVKFFTKMLRGSFSTDKLPPHFLKVNVRFKIMKAARLLGLATLTASVQFLSAADIVGKVTLKGTPPAEKELPVADGFCGPGSTAKVFKGRVFRAAADGGLADVVVYLKEAPAGAAALKDPRVMDQKGCQYEPYVTALQVGQP